MEEKVSTTAWNPLEKKSDIIEEPAKKDEVDIRSLCTVKTEGQDHKQVLARFRFKMPIIKLLRQNNNEAKSIARKIVNQLIVNHCEKEGWPKAGRRIKINTFRIYADPKDETAWEAISI